MVTEKLPLSVIYASWAGLGVFSVAILSSIFYKQALNWQSVAGLFLIVVELLLLTSTSINNLGAITFSDYP